MCIFISSYHQRSKVINSMGTNSVKTAEKLRQDGVPVILKSDHPVLSGADLAYIASRTAYYGFDVQVLSFNSVSSNLHLFGGWVMGFFF